MKAAKFDYLQPRALDEALQANCRSGRNAELIRAYALPAAACVASVPPPR